MVCAAQVFVTVPLDAVHPFVTPPLLPVSAFDTATRVKLALDEAVAPIGVLLIFPPAIVTAVELKMLIVALDAITPLVTVRLLIVAVLLTVSWSTTSSAVDHAEMPSCAL